MIDGHRDAWKYNSLNLYETSLEWEASCHFSDSLNDLGLCFQKKERVPSSVCVFVLKA